MYVILSLLAIFSILVFNELLWRKKAVHGEFSRKFVHVSVGCFVAFWPFYLSWTAIRILGLAFVVVVVLSKVLKIFQAINSVQRPTWGEICFALAVIIVSFITHNKWIYATAILQMSLADGLAAIVGVRYGGKYSYLVFNHTKSIIGTLTFFIVSCFVLLGYNHFGMGDLGIRFILLTSFTTCLLENIAVLGLDNLFVPVFIAYLISNH
jgi:phytol kinase